MQFKRREGLLSAIFGVLTCGLYNIYFWYRYGEDVNVICSDDGKETMNYIVAWLLSVLTCGIYGMYWTYTLASRLDTASKKYDVNVESPVFFTLFMNIPFLSYFYSCDVMNKFQEKYEAMYPNGNGYGGNGYGGNNYGGSNYGGNVPPVSPNGGGNAQSLGAQIGSQFKSAVQEMGNGIKNSAQSTMQQTMFTCKNCGALVPPGKNYCKNCGYPVNGPAPQNSQSQERTSSGSEMELKEQPVPNMEIQPQVQQTYENKEVPEKPSPVLCPKCGNVVKPGDRFCIHCGSKIE